MKNRLQISTDGLEMYRSGIASAFGLQVDHGIAVKSFEAEPIGPGRYSSPRVTEAEKSAVIGAPDEELISTSGVERHCSRLQPQG